MDALYAFNIPIEKFRWRSETKGNTLTIKGKTTIVCVMEPLMSSNDPTEYLLPNVANVELFTNFNGMKNIKQALRFMTRPFLILVLITMIGDLLYAQNSQISTYTLKDGVPQSQVYDIIQDKMGYLWLGTQGGGIARFDGVRFKVWSERDGLLSNFVDALAFSNDSLFIGTRQGLAIKTKQGFTNVACPKSIR